MELPYCQVMVGGVLTLLSGVAAAQTSATPTPGSGGLEEVVVTATKLAATDVNKVPISISVYSQQDLDVRGVRNIADLAAITPGLIMTRQNDNGTAQTNIEIRGIQSRTSAPTTGIYIDDTALIGRSNNVNTGESTAYPLVFDLDRVEVLRGPQGTLFGASSEGGAVRFITKQPDLTQASGYAKAEVADTEYGAPSWEAGFAGGAPLIENTLAFRASVWYRLDGGYVDRVEPPLALGPFTESSNPQAPGGGLLDPNSNWSESRAAKLAVTWAPSDGLRITPSVYYQDVYQHDSGNYDLNFSNPGQGIFGIAHSQQLPGDDQNTISSVKIESLQGSFDITSITSDYQRRATWETDYTQFQDNAFFGNPWPFAAPASAVALGIDSDVGTGYYETTINAYSEELRVSSTDSDARLTWVGGAFFEYSRQEDSVYVAHLDLPELVEQIYDNSILNILGANPYEGLWVAFDDVRTRDEQTALFGNVNFKFTSTLKATLGLRAAYATSFTYLHYDGPFNGGPGFFSGNERDKPVTPKADISWQPNSDTNFYVSVGKGYRVGGVNPQINNTQPACQTALAADDLVGKLSRTYSPDSLWSYEIGTKDQLLDNRLEVQASIYHILWNNIQQVAQISNCGFAAVFNLGSATSNGFDLSVRTAVFDELQLGLQVAYTDAHYNSSEGNIVAAGDVIGGPSTSSGQAVPPGPLPRPPSTPCRCSAKRAIFGRRISTTA